MITKEDLLSIIASVSAEDFEQEGKATEYANQVLQALDGYKGDPTTEAGRKEIKSVARAIAGVCVSFDNIGKDHKASLSKTITLIDSERNAFKNPVRSRQASLLQPVSQIEEREAARIEEHEWLISQIKELGTITNYLTLDQVQYRLKRLSSLMQRDYEEFSDQASIANDEAQSSLHNEMQAATERKKRDDALRQQEIDNAAQAAIIAQQARHDAQMQRMKDEHEQKLRQQAQAENKKKEQEAAAARLREQDQENRKLVKRAALAAFTNAGIDPDVARSVIIAIANGRIPNIKIHY